MHGIEDTRSQFSCEAPAGRDEGAANLGSDPKNARARIASVCESAPDPIPQTPCGRAEQRSGRRIRASDCLSEVQRSEFELDPACREQRKEPRSEAQGT